MSCTSTSTSTSSKAAGKLTLSGGSMHPSQATALFNPTDLGEQQAERAPLGVYGLLAARSCRALGVPRA